MLNARKIYWSNQVNLKRKCAKVNVWIMKNERANGANEANEWMVEHNKPSTVQKLNCEKSENRERAINCQQFIFQLSLIFSTSFFHFCFCFNEVHQCQKLINKELWNFTACLPVGWIDGKKEADREKVRRQKTAGLYFALCIFTLFPMNKFPLSASVEWKCANAYADIARWIISLLPEFGFLDLRKRRRLVLWEQNHRKSLYRLNAPLRSILFSSILNAHESTFSRKNGDEMVLQALVFWCLFASFFESKCSSSYIIWKLSACYDICQSILSSQFRFWWPMNDDRLSEIKCMDKTKEAIELHALNYKIFRFIVTIHTPTHTSTPTHTHTHTQAHSQRVIKWKKGCDEYRKKKKENGKDSCLRTCSA